MLFGVDARDGWTYLGVVMVLLVTTMAAMAAPAVRASRIDAAQALREG